MPKQLNIDLNFNANTEKAKAAIQDLQTSLSKIAYSGSTLGKNTPYGAQLKQASEAAKQLSFHLNNAFNADTGKLDLSRLDKSLKSSKTNLSSLTSQLLTAGETGQQAFMHLAQSIAQADQPIFRINKRLTEMGTVLKNTVRWQLSSSILHGFMGSVQQAYHYAQDLNESLNNIRIVTGQDAEQMAVFAEKANKAAKALNTTTTRYTNASLIYYQQGLSDAEVSERTDVTVKMANVARESAEVVSDQLTAVWNNFNKEGERSAEYFADVMTALGAATASSTSEISEGLNKFAAIAETVGLSYEYATAALTTVTATTRQSADVVGTAFKTMFARIQGLKLGETLEDGTTLNKYSEALMSVGISIKDQNGQLRDMDSILVDMGAKWKTLDKDQQVALAQTVAGTRQYTQLVALMDNWDFMEENLETVANAEGALQEQADIYAESWEAASNRVRASMETVYQAVLDDKFFISLNNGFANAATGVGEFLKEFGGLKNIVIAISGIFMSNFAHKIPEAIDNLKFNFQYLTKGSEAAYKEIQNQMNQATQQAFTQGNISKDSPTGFAIESANNLSAARSKLALMADQMSSSEKQAAEMTLALADAQAKEAYELQKTNEELEKKIAQEQQALLSEPPSTIEKAAEKGRNLDVDEVFQVPDDMDEDISDIALDQLANFKESYIDLVGDMDDLSSTFGENLLKMFRGLPASDSNPLRTYLESFQESLNNIDTNNLKTAQTEFKKLSELIPNAVRNASGLQDSFQKVFKATDINEFKIALADLKDQMKEANIPADKLEKVLSSIYGPGFKNLAADVKQLDTNLTKVANLKGTFKGMLEEFQPKHIVSTSEAIGAMGGMMTNTAMLINNVTSAFKTLSNPDLSGWQKFSALLTSVGMLIPMVTSGLKSYATVQSFLTKQMEAYSAANLAANAVEVNGAKVRLGLAKAEVISKGLLKKEIDETTLAKMSENIANLTGCNQTKLQIALETLYKTKKQQGIAVKIKDIVATYGQVVAEETLNGKRTFGITLQTILNALTGKYGALWAGIGIGAIILALIGLVKVLDKIILTQDEANKKIEESTKRYKEASQEAEEAENKLEDLNKKIKELEEQGPLSLVEQEELNKLKVSRAELEQVKNLKEQIAAIEAKAAFNDINNNWNTASKLSVGNAPKSHQYLTQSGLHTYADEQAYAKSKGFKGKIYGEDGQTTTEYAEWAKDHTEEASVISNWNEDKANANFNANKEQIVANENMFANVVDMVAKGYIDKSEVNWDQYFDILKQGREMAYPEAGEYEKTYLGSKVSSMEGYSKEDFLKDPKDTNWAKLLPEDMLRNSGIKDTDFDAYIDGQIQDLLSKGISSEQLAKLDSSKLMALIKFADDLGKSENGYTDAEIENFVRPKIEEGDIPAATPVEDFSKQQKVLKKLKLGTTIGEEDYNLLGEEYQKYFQLQADGTHKLIVSAEELKRATAEIQTEDLQKDIQQKKEQINSVNAPAENGSPEGLGDKFSNFFANGGTNAEWSEIFGSSFNNEDYSQYGRDFINQLNETYKTDFDAGDNPNTVDPEALQAAANYYNQQKDAIIQEEAALAQVANTMSEINNLDISSDAKHKAIVNMASGYKECSKELDAYNRTLDKNGKETKDSAKAYRKLKEALAKVEWKKFTKDALKSAKALEKATDPTEIQGHLEVIADAFRNDLGIDVAAEDLEKYKDKLVEWAKAGEEESDDLATQLMSLVNFDKNQDMIKELEITANINPAEQEYSKLLENTDLLKSLIEANPPTVTATGYADFSSLIAALIDAGATAADVAAVLQMIGQTEVDLSSWGSGFGNYDLTTPEGLQGFIQDFGNWSGKIKIDKATYPDADAVQKAFPGSIGGTGGGRHTSGSDKKGGGGGGGDKKKSKPTEVSKADDILDRYKEINDSLDDNAEKLEDISDISDRLYGANKLKAMEAQNDLIKEEIRLNKEKKKQAEAYLEIDKHNLEIAAQNAGVSLDINEHGNITNYTSVMEGLAKELIDAQKAANADGDATEEEEEQIQQIQDKIDFLKDAIEQYDETKELIEDLDNEIQDQIEALQDNNAEMLAYKVEIKVELNESELDIIEYYMDKIADDFYKMAENAALLGNKSPIFQDTLQVQKDYYNALTEAYKNEEISQAAYVEGLKNCKEAILENLSSLNELDKEMLEYYGNTLAAAGEELAKYTSQMEHQTSVLEHYANIMDLLGQSTDYDKMGVILEGQGQAIKNELEVAKKAYEQNLAETNKWKAKMDAAVSDPAAYEVYKKNWEAAVEATQEAQETMLSKTEAYIEQMKAILENSLNKSNKKLEDALTNGLGFDKMNTDLERAQSLQEDYLTTTNKIFETNKLMQKAQNDLDKSSNKLAKDKLDKFIEETKQLQEKGKLSKFELDIQKAKYDLLVAEMALEDAKNAKSQVRLERDSEGNFSYVYTADADKVNEAQDKFNQAQNDLYNISLEGANKYAEQYQQALNDFYNSMTELQQRWLDGEFKNQEEYDKAVADTQAYYYEQLSNYSDLYQIALKTDGRIVDGIWQGSQDLMDQAQDNWITNSQGMIEASAEWKDTISAHLEEVRNAFQTWRDDLSKVKIDSKGSLDEISKEVDKVVDNSNNLADVTQNEVIPALQDEIDKVGELSEQFADARQSLKDLIAEYEQLVESIHQEINFQATIPNIEDLPKPNGDDAFTMPDQEVHIHFPTPRPSGGGGGSSSSGGGSPRPGGPSGLGGPNNPSSGNIFNDDQRHDNFINSNHIDHEINHTDPFNKNNNYQAAGYATGGYTGVWGPEGKLAVLHEKEIVLNKDDTLNMFKSLDLTRQILQTIDLNANQASIGLGSLSSPGLKDTSAQTLEQEVTIHAEFPNVNNHSEIEEAFNNLVNQASQFANRKKI